MTRAALSHARLQRHDLPLRDWASTDIDPAVVLVRLLRADAQLVSNLHDRFEDAGLPPFDIARLLWLWSEHTVPLSITAERLGLVERSRDMFDGRQTAVRVTTQGRAAIHRFDSALRAAARDLRIDDSVAEWLARRHASSR